MKEEAKVKQALIKVGIVAEVFSENGRTFQGNGIYLGKEAVHFKVAKSENDRLRLENSIYFAKQLQKDNPPFLIPKILKTGYLKSGQLYKIETTLKGVPFTKMANGIAVFQVNDPQTYFPSLVKGILWIQQRKDLILPATFDAQLGANFDQLQNKLIKTMIRWAETSTPRIVELLKIMEGNKDALRQGVAHGDLTPINTIVNPEDKSVGFVDMDLATEAAPKYYDLAEFFNRLYTAVCNPKLAKLFLQETIKNIPKSEKRLFLQQFLVILAYRAVGNFYEISKLSLTDEREKRRRFAKDFAEYVADKKFIDALDLRP